MCVGVARYASLIGTSAVTISSLISVRTAG